MPPSPLSARAFFADPEGFAAEHRVAGEPLVPMAAGRAPYALVLEPAAIWSLLVTEGPAFAPGKWKRRARRFVGPALNTLHGAEHRERRTLLAPALGRPRVTRFGEAIAARAQAAQAGWRAGETLVLRDALDPLSLAMAGDVLLSADLGPEAQAIAGDLRAVMAGVPRLVPPLPGTGHGRALAALRGRIDALAAARRAGGPGDPDDVLGVLLGAGLPGEVVRGEVLAFLLAAVDEPPSALEAAWWLLGRHPEADARLAAELGDVLGDRPPALADLERLPWLGAVIDEALRLFPPARHIDRCPAHDATIAGRPVAAGTNVIVSPLVTQRDPALFPDPDAFRPERMLDRRAARREAGRGALIPFGAGVHACIGEPLARTIMALTLAGVARRWRLVTDPAAPAPSPRAPRLRVEIAPR